MTTAMLTQGIPLAGYDSETHGEYRLKVLLGYTATYVHSERAVEVLAPEVWVVTMSSRFDGLILRIE